jgi:putative ABC transport system permease protein
MIKNYFKIALRNIKRYSTYSILNISGMAIGMASAILILLWVQDEWSYDRHFKNADDLYRVIENQNLSGGGSSLIVPTPGALAPALKEEYPEIIRSVRFCPNPLTLKKGDEFIEETVTSVDKDFLNMFNIKFVRGDINTALNNPHNIVITEETAKKYFGDEEALGKTLTSRGYVVTVTGVVKSMPHNSHIQFNFLVPIEWLTDLGAHINGWGERFNTYIELKKGTDSKIVDKKILDFIKKHNKESNSEIFLQNIKKIHLYSSGKYVADSYGTGDITYVRILTLIAVFILIIACINFLNLSTAQSARRAREIGVRKVAGANKGKIVSQFLGESLLIVLVAHVIAMIFVELLLPGFNNLIGKQLSVNYQSAGLYIWLIAVVLFCGLLAGSYPAFYLSSLKPLDIIKGVINKNPGNAQFRRVLVIFQFSLSILLIICTLIVETQLKYIQNKNLGFNKDNIGYFMFPTRPSDPKLESLKKELISNPDILSVTKAWNPFYNDGTRNGFTWAGKKEGDDVLFHVLGADVDYAKTYRLELKEGRFFSSEFSSDNTAIVINEQAAKILDFKNPIGEKITTPQGSKLNIIGVIKDFHIQSLHYKIGPLIMQIGASNNFYIKMKPDKIISTVESIKKTYKSFNPGLPIDFHFLDDDYDNLYRTEQRMGKIFGYFSFLAIIISCLGLIGLSSFMTERRTKETGIRKINGAKSNEIFSLLSREYIIWVMISIIIACPIAWYVMHKWLQNFAYRINISWWVFALAGVIALLIAFLTVSWQSFKAASKNPVEALRYE